MSEFYGLNLDQGPDSKSYDPRTGWTIRRPFTGSPVAIASIIPLLVIDGVKFDHEAPITGGYERIIVILGQEDTQSRDVPLIDEWERDMNMFEKGLWEIPKVQREMAKFNDPTIAAKFRADIEALVRGETTTSLPDGTNTLLVFQDVLAIATNAPFNLDAKIVTDLFFALGRGTQSKLIPAYVLKRTRTIGHNSTIQPDDANVGQIFSTTQLKSVEPIPTTIRFSLPPDYFWLKMGATVTQESGTRWRINQEWWGAEFYDPFAYDAV